MDQEEQDYIATRGGEISPKKEEAPVEEKAAEPEVVAEEVDDDPPSVDVPHVPYGRFKEERDKRKAERDRALELERQVARFEGELKALKEASIKPPEPVKEEKPVDWDQDPKAAHDFVQKQAAELKQRLENQEKQTKHREAHERFMNDYRAKVTEYTEKAPEFSEAYNYLFDSRLKEYQAAGLDYQQAHAKVLNDEEQTVLHALVNGKNPGEILHNIAKTRGFKPKAKVEDKVETVARGSKIATSIGNGSGSGTATPVTLEALAEMDDEDFRKHMASSETSRRKFWEKHGG